MFDYLITLFWLSEKLYNLVDDIKGFDYNDTNIDLYVDQWSESGNKIR